jgi:hypothetical protein
VGETCTSTGDRACHYVWRDMALGHGTFRDTGTWRDVAGHDIEACCQVSRATKEHECAGCAMGLVFHQQSLLLISLQMLLSSVFGQRMRTTQTWLPSFPTPFLSLTGCLAT